MVPELSRRRFIAGCGIAGSTALAAGASALGTSNDSTEAGNAVPPPTTRWNRTYRSGINDQVHAVAQAPDDGYVVAGTTTPSDDDDARDAWLFKVGPTGELSWERTFSERYVTVAKGLSRVDDGYVVAGYTNDGATSDQSGLVIRVDGQGVEQWRETVDRDPDTDTTDQFEAVDVDQQGNFVLAGRSSRLDSGWVVRMDAAGTVILDHLAQEGRQNHFYGVVADSDGNYVAAGQTDTSEGPLGGWAYKIDGQGNTQWSETYYRGSGPQADDYNLFYDIIEISDGFVMVGANAASMNASERRGWIMMSNNFGGRQWATRVTDRPFTEFHTVVEGDLEFFAAGFTSEDMGTENRDGFVSRFIVTGSQDWAARYQGAGASTVTAITRSDDGGLYGFGRTASTPGGPFSGWGVKAGGTALSTPTQTASPTPSPTDSPTPTATDTPTPTATDSPTPSPTPSPTDSPTPTATDTPTATATQRPADPTPTATDTPTDQPAGPTATEVPPTDPPGGTPTDTPLVTATDEGGGGGGLSPTVLGVGAAILALGAGGLLYNRFAGGDGDANGGGGQGGQPPQGGQGGQPPQGGQGGQPPQGGQGQPPQGGQGGQPPQGGQGAQPPQGGQGQPPQGGQGGQGGQPPQGGQGAPAGEGAGAGGADAGGADGGTDAGGDDTGASGEDGASGDATESDGGADAGAESDADSGADDENATE